MNNQPHMPEPEVDKRLIANMRQSRLRMEEAMLEIDEITAKLEHNIRQKSLARVKKSLNSYQEKSPNFEQQ